MMREHETVVLNEDLPAYGLRRGGVGVVVMVHGSRGYEVEFMTLGGRTVAVVSLEASKVRPVDESEIAHVRRIQAA